MSHEIEPQQSRSLGDFLLRHRIFLTWLASIGLIARLVLLRQWHQHQLRNPLEWSDSVSMIGTGLCGFGLAFRTWACSVIQKRKELAQHGPYSLCRHPLYFGSALMMAGFLVLINDPFTALAFGAVMILIYRATIRGEEQWLSAAFPESWPAYHQAIPQFLPRKVRGPFGPISVQSWRSNREYRTVLSVFFGLVLVWYMSLPVTKPTTNPVSKVGSSYQGE